MFALSRKGRGSRGREGHQESLITAEQDSPAHGAGQVIFGMEHENDEHDTCRGNIRRIFLNSHHRSLSPPVSCPLFCVLPHLVRNAGEGRKVRRLGFWALTWGISEIGPCFAAQNRKRGKMGKARRERCMDELYDKVKKEAAILKYSLSHSVLFCPVLFSPPTPPTNSFSEEELPESRTAMSSRQQ